jgi:hypothetical protein
MNKDYSKFYPKARTGKECKKTNCERYESYKRWDCGDSKLNFCIECKNSHVSQYKAKLINNTPPAR